MSSELLTEQARIATTIAMLDEAAAGSFDSITLVREGRREGRDERHASTVRVS